MEALGHRAHEPEEKLAAFFDANIEPGPILAKALAAALRGQSEPTYMNLGIASLGTADDKEFHARKKRIKKFLTFDKHCDHAKAVQDLIDQGMKAGAAQDQYCSQEGVGEKTLEKCRAKYQDFLDWIAKNAPDPEAALQDEEFVLFLRSYYHAD